MSIDMVESRIAALQSQLSALSAGQTPSMASTSMDVSGALSFSDVLNAQNGDLSTMLDAVGNPTDGSDDGSSADGTADTDSSGSSISDQLSSLLGSTGSTGSSSSLSSTLASFDGSTGSALGSIDSSTGSTTGPTGGDVVIDAEKYLGIPYRWGGTNPATGLDCSGLVQRVMKDLGVTMPRTVAQQRNVGTPVDSLADAKPGDLLVFGSHHIGIYLGGGKMLHAPHTGDHVRISDVYETPTRIRRVLPSGGATQIATDVSAIDTVRPAALRDSGSGSSAHRYDALFTQATSTYNLPSGLLRAVASVESSFNAKAVSPAGAEGLMQLMPGTARDLKVNPMDPAQAVDGAARMLSGLIHQFGSVKLAVAAYNAGPGAVKKYGGVPPYAETQSYVRKVISRMETS